MGLINRLRYRFCLNKKYKNSSITLNNIITAFPNNEACQHRQNRKQKPQACHSPYFVFTSSFSPPSLNIKALTWSRDSHGLYDYESFQLVKNTLKLERNCVLGRIGNDVKILSESELAQCELPFCRDKIIKLAAIKCEGGNSIQFIHLIGKYYIDSCSNKSIYDVQLDKLWLVIRSLQAQTPKKVRCLLGFA